jgi:glycosyltransferase involved in cell wall biosynthesis
LNKQYINTEVLWLASWYPNELSPYDGDFIQRHAQAVARFQKITVIHVRKDEAGIITKNKREVITSSNNLTEIIVYYHSYITGINLVDKLISSWRFKKVYRESLLNYIEEKGKPKLIHVHVAIKAGYMALWCRKKFGILFILSEHWSGYLPAAPYGLKNLNFFAKNRLKKIFKKTQVVTVVSNALGEAMAHMYKIKTTLVIPNVVNTDIFYPVENNINSIPSFIHISSLGIEKNTENIIEAFELINKKGIPFRLYIFGPIKKSLTDLVEEKNLAAQILFKGEVPQNLLAADMQSADALVQFSRYETFGCVVIEANACGVPAILSDLPVFREYVEENVNGIFVSENNEKLLAEKIISFISNRNLFDKMQIAKVAAEKFSYPVIGQQFYNLYESALLS